MFRFQSVYGTSEITVQIPVYDESRKSLTSLRSGGLISQGNPWHLVSWGLQDWLSRGNPWHIVSWGLQDWLSQGNPWHLVSSGLQDWLSLWTCPSFFSGRGYIYKLYFPGVTITLFYKLKVKNKSTFFHLRKSMFMKLFLLVGIQWILIYRNIRVLVQLSKKMWHKAVYNCGISYNLQHKKCILALFSDKRNVWQN